MILYFRNEVSGELRCRYLISYSYEETKMQSKQEV